MSKRNEPNPKLPGSQRTNEQGQPVDANDQVVEGPTELPAGAPAAAEAGTPAPEHAPEPKDAAALEAERMEKIKQRSFKDSTRDAIAKRARERRDEENQAFREGNLEQAALSDAVAGVEHVTPDLIARMEAEARGEPDPAEQRAHAPSTPAAPAAASAPAPLASSPSTFRIRVYGQEREVSEEEVRQAGIAALQKQHAGDQRLEEAATYEAQLDEYAERLKAYAESLKSGRPADGTQQQPTGGSANPQPPNTGAAGQEVGKLRAKARAALLRGDDAEAAQFDEQADALLLQLATSATAKPAQPEQRSSEQGALPEPPARVTREPWSRDDRVKINQVFAAEYGDLLANDDTFVDAKALMDARLADARYAGWTPEQVARDVGERIRRAHDVQAPAPAPTPTPVQQTLEGRRILKAQIPITPPAGSTRAPSSVAQAPRYPTRSEYVQSLRQRSGSNSSR